MKPKLLAMLSWIVFVLSSAGVPLRAHDPGARRYQIAFAPVPGLNLIYALSSRVNTEGNGFAGKSIALSATASGEIELGIKGSAPDLMIASLTSPGIRINTQVLDKSAQTTLAAGTNEPVLIEFEKTGRIREIRNAEALEKKNIMNVSIMEMLRAYFPVLSDRPVSPGDSWVARKKLIIPFQGCDLEVLLAVTFVLNDIVNSREGRSAVIGAAYSVTLAGSRRMDNVTGSFEGTGSGSGSLSFLMDRGYFTDYRLDYQIGGAMVVRKGGEKLLEWPFTLSASAALELVSATSRVRRTPVR
jgi:hypothetical protein